MDITTLHIIVLAIIQGVTEFLPISSSAHLVLIPQLLGWEDQGLAVDVAMHIGSLAAVLIYFRKDLSNLLGSWLQSLRTHQLTAESRLVWGVGIATIPVAVVGLAMSHWHWEEAMRTPFWIALALIGFGLLLWWADVVSKQERDEMSLSLLDIFWIGLAQSLALIHGASRSGVTMTAGLLLGLKRQAAARFSFLLSIPAILLAGMADVMDWVTQPPAIAWHDLLIGMVVSGLSAYLCIKIFLGLLERIGMLPFVIYRLLLGMALLIWVV